MTHVSDVEPGKYLWWDLRLYRERQGISLAQLAQRLRLSTEVLEAFEQTGLVGHPLYPEVYVRALLRAYAREVGLPPDEVVHYYAQSLKGTYRGQLAARYLGIPIPEAEEAGEEPVPEAVPPPPPRRMFSILEYRMREARRQKWYFNPLSFALLVVFLAAAAFLLWWLFLRQTGSVPPGGSSALPDTLRLERVDTLLQAVQRPPVRPSVGDSLDIWVIARGGKLEPIEVQVDTGKVWFRPYGEPPGVYRLQPNAWTPLWIEEGDTLRIWARHRVGLRNFLSRIYLEVEGHPWPVPPGRRQLFLTRERVQAFLDSLSQSRTSEP